MKNNVQFFYHSLILLLLFGSAIYAVQHVGYTSEIYLNYQSGYIRRGLIGEIFYQLPFNKKNLSNTLYVFQYIIFIVSIFYFWRKLKIPTSIIFSMPLIVGGFLFSTGRLDFLIFVLFLVQFLWIEKCSNNGFKNIATLLLSIIAISIHEIYFFIFLIPFLIQIFRKKDYSRLIILIIIGCFFLAENVFFKGDLMQIKNIEESWSKINFYPDFSYVYRTINEPLILMIDAIDTRLQVIGFILNNLLVVFFLLISVSKFLDKKDFQLFLFIILSQDILFFIISYFACDYGRWYFLLFTSIIYYFFAYKDNIPFNKNFSGNFFRFFRKLHPISYVLYFFVGVTSWTWSLNYFLINMPITKLYSLFVKAVNVIN